MWFNHGMLREQLDELIQKLKREVISKYMTDPQLMLNDDNVQYPNSFYCTAIVPLLSPHQLKASDIDWLQESFPEVVDFLNNHKPNKSVCCQVIIDEKDSPETIFENIKSFYETNYKYLREIITGCLIEEILFDHIPQLFCDQLDKYVYTPVEKLKSYVLIKNSNDILIYRINTRLELITPFDVVELVNSKLFRFHQKVVASLVPIN